MYEEGNEEAGYVPPAGGFKARLSYHFEGLIPLILILIVVVLAGAWLGFWDIPYITHSAPAKMLVIGQPSQETTAVLDDLKDLVQYRIRSADSLRISPKEQLAQYDIIMLDQSNSTAGPFVSRALGEAIRGYVKKGGKLIIVKNSGIFREGAPEIVGWLANMGDLAPVECVPDKQNVPTCVQPIWVTGELIRIDFEHPIMEGIEKVPALPGDPPLSVEVFDVAVKGNEIAYIKDLYSTKYYPGIVEKNLILGKVIYFNYDPGKTPGILQKTIRYLR